MRFSSPWRAAVGLAMAQQVLAGFMTVNVNTTAQCQNATVTWSGDDGPWHLLLTPTDFFQHSYNLWVPEIPVGAKNWTIPMNQPAGTTFMVTMWGNSGIRFAGTTDVLTVGSPPAATNATCFLTDAQILALYTFSFNISDTAGYPPECSNLSMTWPSSLDNNVQGRQFTLPQAEMNHFDARQTGPISDNPSSSDRKGGNTTNPPTMFGIIPMGNSFSIPITFSKNYADRLPQSVISDSPTTWTRQGVTHLNWTIGLSKGTRFILVAGIGDEKQWASGGSSRMLTVGQGSTGCYGFADQGGATTDVPSITGESTATHTLSIPSDEASAGSSTPRLNAIGTTVVSVLSVLVTLALVGICFCCYRIRRRRRKAATLTAFTDAKPLGTYKRRSDDDSEGHQLDILSPSASVSDSNVHRPPPIDTSPTTLSSPRGDPFRDTPQRMTPQTGTFNTFTSTSTMSPIERVRASAVRQTSQEYLLSGGSSPTHPTPSSSAYPTLSTYATLSTHRPLTHGGHEGLPIEDGDVTDLKLETIAQFDRDGNRMAGSSRRRPVEEEEDLEYVVHRDAGRVRELPPRYEDMNWEEEEGRAGPERGPERRNDTERID